MIKLKSEATNNSERMNYAQQLERIEAKKAKDRKTSKLKQNKDTDMVHGPQREGTTRDIVGSFGFRSNRAYNKQLHQIDLR
ncbi:MULTISPECIES: hypothetical protein [Staphylococcus]|uniref:hypothetical protein n=1 Tax=Staphylococcus TaxID=1279 RepID=UPI0021BDC03F|nr:MULTISPECIES: hypothetical protein [Staphylococcus]MEB7824695.1 hypothetical protein [Staphylococcus chromogenes]